MNRNTLWLIATMAVFGFLSIFVWGWFGPFAGALWSTSAYFAGQMTAIMRRPTDGVREVPRG